MRQLGRIEDRFLGALVGQSPLERRYMFVDTGVVRLERRINVVGCLSYGRFAHSVHSFDIERTCYHEAADSPTKDLAADQSLDTVSALRHNIPTEFQRVRLLVQANPFLRETERCERSRRIVRFGG